jgi:hypothetical protein
MAIIPARIVQQHRFGMVKEKHAAEHIVVAEVADKIRSGTGVACGDPEVMVGITHILSQVRLRAGESKNTRLSIRAYLVLDQRWTTLCAIDDDPG